MYAKFHEEILKHYHFLGFQTLKVDLLKTYERDILVFGNKATK